MREHELKTRNDLENEIFRITGVKVGPHYPRQDIAAIHFNAIDGLVTEWLRRCNLNEGKISRLGISNGGRARAYCAGVNWVVNNLVNDTKPEPNPRAPRTRRGFGTKIDTSDFSFDDNNNDEDNDDDDLGKMLGLPKSNPDALPDPSDDDSITITKAALKKATDAILGPQVEILRNKVIASSSAAMRQKLSELDQDIENRVKVEIASERAEATNRAITAATTAAVEAALKAAEDFIIKRVPRRIELYTPKETKALPDEPRHKAFEEILFYANLGMHVYMWGPRGTGKTHIFPQICDALGRKYYPISQSLSRYDVTGYNSATGQYIKTHARDAMEFGGVLGVDEGDTWAGAALIALNTPLANRYCPFPDKVIQVHPDFLCMLAANTSGFGATPEYSGRNPIDSTNTDRFVFIHVDYDEDLEIQIFGNTPWTRYIHEVRKYVRDELKNPFALPSMRPIQMGTKALAAGGDPESVVRACLWKALPQDTVNKIESRCGKFARRHLQEVETEAAD
jgi:AAA domain (dynein-related subfamily)